jgi:hypothetical protein
MACKAYVPATGVLNVQEAPAHSPTITVAPQKRSCHVLAQAAKAYRQILH